MDVVQGGSDIEIHSVLSGPLVKIDDVASLHAVAPVDEPIVSIEGRVVKAKVCGEEGLGGQIFGTTHEPHQPGRAAGMEGVLPRENAEPGALVHGVVDGEDDGHVGRDGVVALVAHGVVELLLGGVHPVRAGGGLVQRNRALSSR